ncbi:MAG: hypothetical protein KAI81_02110 [Candidatus Marinimicrobia bacterium]|nr:hypothetical protein [Candidatus Neomarinimicrobiota bacterium]
MEEHNPHLKKAILEIISNQLRMNDPPETKLTFNRLISEGYSKQETEKFIGSVLSSHIYEILSEKHEFNNSKYVKDLESLPTLPWEE